MKVRLILKKLKIGGKTKKSWDKLGTKNDSILLLIDYQ